MDSKPPVDTDLIDDAALALLFLGAFQRHPSSGALRAWKSFDWGVMGRLHEKELIYDPVNKAKSVWLTEEGVKRAEVVFDQLFRRPERGA
ncbi:DUF6429 family protein [Phenylobacterium sp.]|jgi:preprotein translocase subunit SecA|uniref:DUF6429 family protein n=1 Tax=Phenylobacterium sp. TaxID=1871053 RepID=UPI002F416FFB